MDSTPYPDWEKAWSRLSNGFDVSINFQIAIFTPELKLILPLNGDARAWKKLPLETGSDGQNERSLPPLPGLRKVREAKSVTLYSAVDF